MASEIISRAEAKAKGLNRYFTNTPCKFGHISERIVANAGCVACRWGIEKRYRENNREKYLERCRRSDGNYRDKNREKFRARWRENEKRRNADPAKRLARIKARKKWEDAHVDERAAYIKAWKSENSDKLLEYDRKSYYRNQEKRRAKSRKWHKENSHREDYRQQVCASTHARMLTRVVLVFTKPGALIHLLSLMS